MSTVQDHNPEQGVPSWIINRLGKMVQARTAIDDSQQVIPRGRRGVLLRVCSKTLWGRAGVYCTVAFNLRDMSDETNVEISELAPFDLAAIRG